LTTRDEESDPLAGEFEPFRIDVEPARDSVRVAPVGELDLATVDKLRAEIERLRESGFARIVLDLRGVRFLDSTVCGSCSSSTRRRASAARSSS